MVAFIINTELKDSHYFDEEYFRNQILDEIIVYYFQTPEQELKAVHDAINKNVEKIIIGGEDENTHIALQEIIKKDIVLGVIPMDYSNSISFYLNIQKRNDKIVKMINDNNTIEMDVIVITTDAKRTLYGLNILGLGFSAEVTPEVKITKNDTMLKFWRRLNRKISGFKKVKLKCQFHYFEIEGEFFEVCFLNTGLHSGNISLSKTANPFDGILDVLLIQDQPTSFDFFIFSFYKYFKFAKYPLKYFDFHKAERIRIETADTTKIHLDTVNYTIEDPFTITVKKSGIKVLVPEEFYHKELFSY